MARDRWVTFDCYGTLIDWDAGYSAVLAPLAGPRVGALVASCHRREGALLRTEPHMAYATVLTRSLELV